MCRCSIAEQYDWYFRMNVVLDLTVYTIQYVLRTGTYESTMHCMQYTITITITVYVQHCV